MDDHSQPGINGDNPLNRLGTAAGQARVGREPAPDRLALERALLIDAARAYLNLHGFVTLPAEAIKTVRADFEIDPSFITPELKQPAMQQGVSGAARIIMTDLYKAGILQIIDNKELKPGAYYAILSVVDRANIGLPGQ